jgi:hypothetical protein
MRYLIAIFSNQATLTYNGTIVNTVTVTGAYTLTPGIATLMVTGTI